MKNAITRFISKPQSFFRGPLIGLASAITFVMVVSVPMSTHAQDFIYKSDGALIEGWVTGVTDGKLQYEKAEVPNGPAYSIAQENIEFVFFPNGKYEVFPAYSISNDGGNEQRDWDILISAEGEVQEVQVSDISNNQVRFKTKDNTNGPVYSKMFESLVAVIYKDGKHALFMHPVKATPILKSTKRQVDKLMENQGVFTQASYTPDTTPASITTDEGPTATSAQDGTPIAAQPNSPSELTGIQFEEYSAKALMKIEDLSVYLGYICSKTVDPADANSAIELACELFVSEDATVEVSSVTSTDVIKHPIRKYLGRLKLLKYDYVEVTWADMNYVSDFRLGSDGNYYGTVSLKQTFKGFKDGQLVYGDVTEKQVEVVLKSFDKEVGGQKTLVWDILLSDIGVYNTRV